LEQLSSQITHTTGSLKLIEEQMSLQYRGIDAVREGQFEARERLLVDMETKARERAEAAESEGFKLKGLLNHMEQVWSDRVLCVYNGVNRRVLWCMVCAYLCMCVCVDQVVQNLRSQGGEERERLRMEHRYGMHLTIQISPIIGDLFIRVGAWRRCIAIWRWREEPYRTAPLKS
jgi:hypothetical protein